MQVALLGAKGFVGSHLLRELSNRGHVCKGICRNVYRARELRLIPRVELVPPDVIGNALLDLVSPAEA